MSNAVQTRIHLSAPVKPLNLKRRKVSTHLEYPLQWQRILELSLQTKWSEEDEKEIEELNDKYFGEYVYHKSYDLDIPTPLRPNDKRSFTIVVTHPDGKETIFYSKADALKALRMSGRTLTRHIEWGSPLSKDGWEGCTVREIEPEGFKPSRRKPVIAIDPNGDTHEFESIKLASETLDVSSNSIHNSIREERTLKNGVLRGWRFVEVEG